MTDLLPPYHKPMTSELDCDLANDRVAALEAELERLRCCGNCEHLCENNATLWPCSEGGWTKPIDPCHFTPSRWKEAER